MKLEISARLGRCVALLSGAACLLAAANASAQAPVDDPAAQPPAAADPAAPPAAGTEPTMAEPQPAAPDTAAVPTTPPTVPGEPIQPGKPERAAESAPDGAAATEVAPADAPPPEDAPGGVSVFLFADAYYSYNTQDPDVAHPGHRAYDQFNGFQMSWTGIDVKYDGGAIGATASLRMGSGNPIFFGGDTSPAFYPLTQGFVTWKPSDILTLDLGQFYTIYGAEVAESWNNLNYTRGALYYAMQPFWHSGLRANVAVADGFGLNALVVNGVNQSFAENNAPALGIQALISPNENFSLAAGYLHQTDPDSAVYYPTGLRSVFTHFIDVVATVSVDRLKVIGNFDYNISDAGEDETGADLDKTSFWGASLAVGYGFTDVFAAAIRGEYLNDPDNTVWATEGEEDGNLLTGTLTLEAKPVGDNLVIRWDNRLEKAKNEIFANRDGDPTDTWFNSVLGVVVKSQ
jgi:hypothetical protein